MIRHLHPAPSCADKTPPSRTHQGPSRWRSRTRLCASEQPAVTPESPSTSSPVKSVDDATLLDKAPGKRRRQAESTDPIATFLSRRFGIAGGLAWLGFLAIGSLGEQVKTRLEVAAEEEAAMDVNNAQEVLLPSGVAYTDVKLGGGSTPVKGYLAVVHFVGRANGEVFDDTHTRGKPIVYLWGGRPFAGGLCAGVEEGMANMRAGGRRVIKVPAALGFGPAGAVLRPTLHAGDKSGIVPPDADLEYDIELLRVSIPPS
ncbi:FKBP-type peptidyl-prolyl cis-trans isomerase [Haematococcus lacustris]